jgi:hypothetical protein
LVIVALVLAFILGVREKFHEVDELYRIRPIVLDLHDLPTPRCRLEVR